MDITYRDHAALHPEPLKNEARIHAHLPDGRTLQFCVTHEGVIADLYAGDTFIETMSSEHMDLCERTQNQVGQEPYYGDARIEVSTTGEDFATSQGVAINVRFDEPLETDDKSFGAIKYNFYPHVMTFATVLDDGTLGPSETMSYERFANVFMDQRLPGNDALRHPRLKSPSM